MVKLEKELKWASVLQIAQSSHLDIALACISNVLAEINNELATVDKSSGEFIRLTHLMTLFGGCYYAMRSVDGIVSGMVIDMMDGKLQCYEERC